MNDNEVVSDVTRNDICSVVEILSKDRRVWYKTLPDHPIFTQSKRRSIQTLLMVIKTRGVYRFNDVVRDIMIDI